MINVRWEPSDEAHPYGGVVSRTPWTDVPTNGVVMRFSGRDGVHYFRYYNTINIDTKTAPVIIVGND